MRRYGTFLTLAFSLLFVSPLSFGQKPIDDVLVTGDVTKIVLCHQEDEVRIYNLTITLRAKNIGARPAIISSANATTDFYKLANTLDQLNATNYAHIGWVTSGSPGDPKSAPDAPVAPFKAVPPNGSIDISVELRAIVMESLKPGSAYVQLVAENWPDYSDDYTAKIRRSWAPAGNLWAHSLHSEPIAFVMPAHLKQVSCP